MTDHAQEIGAEFGLSAAEVRLILNAATKGNSSIDHWLRLAVFAAGEESGRLTVNFYKGVITAEPEKWSRIPLGCS